MRASSPGIAFFDDNASKRLAGSARALALLKECDDLELLSVSFEGQPITLDRVVGVGNAKKVYELEDGIVIMLPNFSIDAVDAVYWEGVVKEEITLAAAVNKAGLRAQEYKPATIVINDLPLTVIKAESFSSLIFRGMQVRDRKRKPEEKKHVVNKSTPKGYKVITIDTDDYIGSSDIFGTLENLQDSDFWLAIYSDLVDDVALYILNNFNFTSDSFNLLIEDTNLTKSYDSLQRDLYHERGQRLRLYFYDFSSRLISSAAGNYKIINKNGDVLNSNIESYVTDLVPIITDTILAAASNAECRVIANTEILEGRTTVLSHLSAVARAAAVPQFIAQVVAQISRVVEDIPTEDRLLRFNIDETVHPFKKR